LGAKSCYKNVGGFFENPTVKSCYKIMLCFCSNFCWTILIGPFEILVQILLVLQNHAMKSNSEIVMKISLCNMGRFSKNPATKWSHEIRMQKWGVICGMIQWLPTH